MHKKVKLISSDKKEFLVDEKVAQISKLCKVLLTSKKYSENETKSINLNVNSKLLGVAIEFMEHKFKFFNYEGPVPDFEILNGIESDLLLVSDYLQL
ncbi:elongin C [Tubulinosema ratisbonensis]|uniref:Elongin-C n=1 Tax=Tubulinosema ratisbonensis TaxID=291195 RepID=A0A437AHZ3_9MICR|nr:elongin C [Tubulinosema ratisbonensis]